MRLALVLAFAASSAFAGCSSGTESVSCPAGTAFESGACRTTCARDDDCLRGEHCASTVCVPNELGDPDGGKGDVDTGVSPLACTKTEDCGGTTMEQWSQCMGADPANPCDTSGTRSRRVTERYCNVLNECDLSERIQMEDCMRDTNGDECAPPEEEMFSACSYADDCDETGEQKRTVTTHSCTSGQCMARTAEQTRACNRSTENDSCPPGVEVMYSDCEFQHDCDATGSRGVTTTRYSCHNGQCDVSAIGDGREICTRTVSDGDPCGMDGQCCSGICTSRDDTSNCGVCGVVCDANANCAGFMTQSGQMQYACGCLTDDMCASYGSGGSCAGVSLPFGLCRCECPVGTSPCQGECPSGSCYSNATFGYCGYP